MSFRWEPLDQLLSEGFEELIAEHWDEVAHDKEAVPLAVDWQRYREMEKTGIFKILAMRKDGRFVGYNAFFVMPHLHYRLTLHALNDVIYLDPEHRNAFSGVRLIRRAEKELCALGVVKVMYHAKLHVLLGSKKRGTVGTLLEALGYRHIENVYAKLLRA